MNEYRYKRFTTRLLFRDLRFARKAAAPGDSLPRFDLLSTKGDRLVNDDVFAGKPVFFIFGSMTCPMTASAAPSVQDLYNEFGHRVDFVMLYVRKAHLGENFAQSETIEDKLESARALEKIYNIEWTVAVAGHVASLFKPLGPDQRGIAAVITLGLGMLLVLVLLSTLLIN